MYKRSLYFLLKRLFRHFERLGVHVLPVHYYSPIPEIRKLGIDLWQKISDLPGIEINEDFQLRLLEEFEKLYREEYNSLPLYKHESSGYYIHNPNFGSVDGEIYYCIIRQFKPKKIIEVGAGFSTLLAVEAAEKNDCDCEIVAIDPFPPEFLKKDERIRLIEKPVQEIEFRMFQSLNENDILFIDSTHVVRIGGDVVYLYLDVLPRLKRGGSCARSRYIHANGIS